MIRTIKVWAGALALMLAVVTPTRAIVISEQDPWVQFTSAADQTTFAYPWPILLATDLAVFDEGTLVPVNDYSVTNLGVVTGGNVIFSLGRDSGDIITIQRDTPRARTSQYETGLGFSRSTLDADLNALVKLVQELKVRIDQVPRRTPDDWDGTALTLPDGDVGKCIGWSAGGQLLNRDCCTIGSTCSTAFNATVPGGTRTVTTLQEYLLSGSVFNVQDYGADPGEADSTADIQRAIDDMPNEGGVLYFPGDADPYKFVGVTIDKPMIVAGAGRASKLQANGAGVMISIDEGTVLNFEGQMDGFEMRDLFFDGNGRTTATAALKLAHMDHANFDHLWFEDFLGEAIIFSVSVRESTFNQINIRYCGDIATSKLVLDFTEQGHATPSEQDRTNNIFFTSCTFAFNLGDLAQFDANTGGSSLVRNIHFRDGLWHGPLATGLKFTVTAAMQATRALVVDDAENITVHGYLFSTLGIDVPAIQLTTSNSKVLVYDSRFEPHLASADDMKWGVKADAGTLALFSNFFKGQDPAWETATGVTIHRHGNVFSESQGNPAFLEADDANPAVFFGEMKSGATMTEDAVIETRNAAGALITRWQAHGGTDTDEARILGGVNWRKTTAAPTHTTDADGNALAAVNFTVRAAGGLTTETALYVSIDSGTTWVPFTTTPFPTSGAVTPIGNVTPSYLGQVHIDTVLDNAFIATGTTNTDWTAAISE